MSAIFDFVTPAGDKSNPFQKDLRLLLELYFSLTGANKM